MRDPLDELESFTTPGLTMNPLPAAEVRRRGTRMRRRNNALAAVGGVAAVALIATPLALAANGPDSTRQPTLPIASQSTTTWVTQVPSDFDLGALPQGATYTFTVRKDASVIDDQKLCGATAFSTRSAANPASDVQGATYGEPGTESQAGRTLAVYPDAEAAQAAVDGLRAGIEGCATQQQPPGSPLVNEVTDTAVPGAEDGFVWTNQAKDGDLLYDLTATEVVRVGNAVLLANAFSSAGGPQAMGMLDKLVGDSAPVVEQMCTFSADGC